MPISTRPSSDVPEEPPSRHRRILRRPPGVSSRLVRTSGRGSEADNPTVEFTTMWQPSWEHKFPQDLPLPDGHEEVRSVWAELLSQDEDYRRKYLVRHAIDTNHVENTFELTPSVRGCLLEWHLILKWVQSVDDLVRRGVNEGEVVQTRFFCMFARHYGWERNVIRETVSVSPSPFLTLYSADESRRATTLYPNCQMNRDDSAGRRYVLLMPKSWRPVDSCTPPVTSGTSPQVRLGPPPGGQLSSVEGARLCNVARVRTLTKRLTSSVMRRRCGSLLCGRSLLMQHRQEHIRTRWQNPFATASWLHMQLTQCHPVDVSDVLP